MLAVGGTVCFMLGADISWSQVAAGVFYYTNFDTWFVPTTTFQRECITPTSSSELA